MPISIKMLDDGYGFLMKGEGLITGEDILAGLDERYSTTKKTKKYVYGLSDYTDITKIDMTPAQVRAVATKDRQVSLINPNLILAIAAPQDIMFGLAKMFQGYAHPTGWSIEVFRRIEQAKESILERLDKEFLKEHEIKFQ